MRTKFVPFDLKRMDRALSFKTRGGKVVTQVAHYSDVLDKNPQDTFSIVGVVGGVVRVFTKEGRARGGCIPALLMEIPEKITYPCFCWVSDDRKIPTCSGEYDLIYAKEDLGGLSYRGHKDRWERIVPMTDEEVLKHCGIELAKD
tara:strand:- start:41 stop:475 length:435 start_codon:yes stop_codon:yes gene_type:complete